MQLLPKLLLCAAIVGSCVAARAQEVIPLRPADANRIGEGETIDLYKDDAGDRWYGKISIPTITVLLAPAEKANGAAAIICPGGGYSRELYDREGLEVARWLNSIGIAGIVLKYRLPTDNHDDDEAGMPLDDALRAIRLVRSRAQKWKLRPDRIGIMGFSAGGHVAATAATLFKAGDTGASDAVDRVSSRPDFAALIYPLISIRLDFEKWGKSQLLGPHPTEALLAKYSAAANVSRETPPTFLVLCQDDPFLAPTHVLEYCDAARKAGVPTELHLYAKGGHGFGVRNLGQPGAGSWPLRFEEWFAVTFPKVTREAR